MSAVPRRWWWTTSPRSTTPGPRRSTSMLIESTRWTTAPRSQRSHTGNGFVETRVKPNLYDEWNLSHRQTRCVNEISFKCKIDTKFNRNGDNAIENCVIAVLRIVLLRSIVKTTRWYTRVRVFLDHVKNHLNRDQARSLLSLISPSLIIAGYLCCARFFTSPFTNSTIFNLRRNELRPNTHGTNTRWIWSSAASSGVTSARSFPAVDSRR